jgi:hypothetical protein
VYPVSFSTLQKICNLLTVSQKEMEALYVCFRYNKKSNNAHIRAKIKELFCVLMSIATGNQRGRAVTAASERLSSDRQYLGHNVFF